MTTDSGKSNETPLPRAVRERMQRINAMLESGAAGESAPPPQSPESVDRQADTPTDPPTGGETPPAPTAPAAADPRENDPGYWRQRFQVTQGMLRTFQERQGAELERRDRQITELQDKVRSLEANRAPEKIDLKAFFSPEQIERFGEEQCEAMARTALTAASQEAQKLIETEVKPIREREKQQAKQSQADRETAFWEKLAELQPNYQEINARQDWLAWLMDQDEATGLVRQDILDSHVATQNAIGVAKLFKAFEAGSKRPVPPVAPRSNAGNGGTPPPPQAAVKGYPTRDEIREFYKRSAIGKVSDEERVEFEARLRSKAAA